MRVHIMSICLLMGVAALQSCRTAGPSTTKDIGGSPTDPRIRSYVVFLSQEDSRVRKAECPANTNSVNRSCQGLKVFDGLQKLHYEVGLSRAILALRPGGAPSTPANPTLVKTLEEKITSIQAKMHDGSIYSKWALEEFRRQLSDLDDQLLAAKVPSLTADEQKRHDFIMQKLNANDDVTFSAGDTNYQLAIAPLDYGYSILGPTFVKIPAGSFMMGSPDNEAGRYSKEGPQHQVTISKGFEMQTTEVTQAQWAAVMGYNSNNSRNQKSCPDFTIIAGVPMCPNNPVEQVSWNDAQAFISKLNAKADGYRYRLPTEAEWEYAARAGTTGAYAGDLDAMAWYYKNYYDYKNNPFSGNSQPVGLKQANAWGLFDMHGSVAEWTADWYGGYSASPVTDPVGPRSGSGRVIRGGCWYCEAQNCRSAYRYYYAPDDRLRILGFRLLRTSP